jgi:hypothetical protein
VNRADTQTGGLIRKHWCWVFSIRGGGGGNGVERRCWVRVHVQMEPKHELLLYTSLLVNW